MIIAFWIAVFIYGVGAFFLLIGAIVGLSTAYDSEDRYKASLMLVTIPVWPLYWAKKFVILIAEAVSLIKEKEKK